MKSKMLPLLLIASCFVSRVAAEELTPIDRPTWSIGDTWKYRILDGWNGAERRQYVNTVVAFEGDFVVLRGTSSTNADGFTVRMNADQQSCRSLQNDSSVVCDGPFKFPLSAMYEHKIVKLPFPNGKGTVSGECVGKGVEKVSVPAGEFEAYRVDCKGHWTRIFDGVGYGRIEDSSWYAPAVKRMVKYSMVDFSPQGMPNNKEILELMEFKPASLSAVK